MSRPVEIFEDELRRVCGGFAVEPLKQAGGSIRGSVSVESISRFEVAVVAQDSQKVSRDARLVRSDPGDHLFLLIQNEGICRIDQGGRRTYLHPGDIFLADSASPLDFVCNGRMASQISLHLPRDEVVRRFGSICAGGVGIDRSDPLHIAMNAVLRKMFSEKKAGAPLGEALMGLLGAYFRCLKDRSALSSRKPDVLLASALRLIEERSQDPKFDIDDLSTRMDISRRTLQRQFRALGQTVSGTILNARLDIAWSRLAALGPDTSDGSVASIAFDSGFNDLSYFYRAFRTRFGTSPGAVRKHPSVAR